MLKKVLFSLIFSSIYIFAFDYNLKPVKITKDVWCFLGKLEIPSKENGGFMSNSCYIKADNSYVLIDTGASFQFAKQAYEAMSKIEKLPVKLVINTHSHDDHWLGNNFYKETFKAKILGPSLINTQYSSDSKTRMFEVIKSDAIKGTKIIKIDEIVNEVKNIKIGDKEITIIPVGTKAHTSEDLFVLCQMKRFFFQVI